MRPTVGGSAPLAARLSPLPTLIAGRPGGDEAALRAAVAFFQQPTDDLTEPGAGIPAYAFIPYPVVFVILAKWFFLHPDPDRSARVRLSRWLWRGAASGAHERAAVSLMRLQVRAIQGDDDDADLTALEGAQRPLHRVDWTLQPFHANSATSRIELLALLERRPLHGDGAPVSWREALSSGSGWPGRSSPATPGPASAKRAGGWRGPPRTGPC